MRGGSNGWRPRRQPRDRPLGASVSQTQRWIGAATPRTVKFGWKTRIWLVFRSAQPAGGAEGFDHERKTSAERVRAFRDAEAALLDDQAILLERLDHGLDVRLDPAAQARETDEARRSAGSAPSFGAL